MCVWPIRNKKMVTSHQLNAVTYHSEVFRPLFGRQEVDSCLRWATKGERSASLELLTAKSPAPMMSIPIRISAPLLNRSVPMTRRLPNSTSFSSRILIKYASAERTSLTPRTRLIPMALRLQSSDPPGNHGARRPRIPNRLVFLKSGGGGAFHRRVSGDDSDLIDKDVFPFVVICREGETGRFRHLGKTDPQ